MKSNYVPKKVWRRIESNLVCGVGHSMAQVYPMGDGFMWCIGPQREVLATMPKALVQDNLANWGCLNRLTP